MGAVITFIALAYGTILTKRPWVDEAWFASPAKNLAQYGSMGTYILEPTGSHLSVYYPGVRLDGIERHTYWVMPAYLLVIAAAFKLLGFSLTVLRLPELLWGLAALAAWYAIVRRLGGSPELANLTVFLIGVDYAFVNGASDGRMDMMCASLGFIAIAVYLVFREKHFLLAILLSQTAVALAISTHPNGVIAGVTLAFMIVYLDRRRLSWRVAPLIAAPYAAAGAGWLAYILQDRVAFAAQFGANASDRLTALSAPIKALRLEFTERYLAAHFFPNDAGLGGRLKVLILIAYLTAVLAVIATPALRRNPGYRLLLWITGIQFLGMAWVASFKGAYYLVFITPFYAFFLACIFLSIWRRPGKYRWAAAALLCLVVGLQASWSLQRILWQRPYETQYLPAIRFLRSHLTSHDLVCGSADLAFGLGFDDPRLVDDMWMGRWSGKMPTVIVIDHWYYGGMQNSARKRAPDYYAYSTHLLQSQFHKIYDQRDQYEIYERNETAAP